MVLTISWDLFRSTNKWEKFALEYGHFGLKFCIKEGIFARETVPNFIEFLGENPMFIAFLEKS